MVKNQPIIEKKVLYITRYDPKDINRGSGTFYYFGQYLEAKVKELIMLGPLEPQPKGLFNLILWRVHRIFNITSKKLKLKYRSFQDPIYCYLMCKSLNRNIRFLQYDFIITNEYGIAAYLKTNRPVYIYTDTVFPKQYKTNIHPWLAGLSWVSVKFSQYVTKRGLKKLSKIFVPTNWIVDEILKYNEIGKKDIYILPFGANVEDPGKELLLCREEKVKKWTMLNLLFIGKDWSLKGGEIALKTIEQLNDMGIKANLSIIGTVKQKYNQLLNIKFLGYLDKKVKKDRQILDNEFQNADLLIHPSICEGYVISALEAFAYGLPVVAFSTRGVNDPVKHDYNGILMELGENEIVFALRIKELFLQKEKYMRLVYNARKTFENINNWNVSTSRFLELI